MIARKAITKHTFGGLGCRQASDTPRVAKLAATGAQALLLALVLCGAAPLSLCAAGGVSVQGRQTQQSLMLVYVWGLVGDLGYRA